MISFQTFLEKVQKGVSDCMEEACQVEISTVRKNNGAVYHGLTVASPDSNIYPTIYMDELYQKYMEGWALSDIVKRAVRVYEEHRIEGRVDMQFLLDFTQARERIVYKLIHYENNREMLSEMPHRRFLDMAVVFYCSIWHASFGSVTIPIKNSLCRIWEVEEAELAAIAKENTPRLLPPGIMDICQLLEEDGAAAPGKEARRRMYVLTNSRKQFGAACILYPGLLRDFAQAAGGGFYILPSSVHEVILVPEAPMLRAEEFTDIVREINRTQVEAEEVLSDTVYYYSAEEGKVKILSEMT